MLNLPPLPPLFTSSASILALCSILHLKTAPAHLEQQRPCTSGAAAPLHTGAVVPIQDGDGLVYPELKRLSGRRVGRRSGKLGLIPALSALCNIPHRHVVQGLLMNWSSPSPGSRHWLSGRNMCLCVDSKCPGRKMALSWSGVGFWGQVSGQVCLLKPLHSLVSMVERPFSPNHNQLFRNTENICVNCHWFWGRWEPTNQPTRKNKDNTVVVCFF